MPKKGDTKEINGALYTYDGSGYARSGMWPDEMEDSSLVYQLGNPYSPKPSSDSDMSYFFDNTITNQSGDSRLYRDIDREKFLQSIEKYRDTDWYNQYIDAINAYEGVKWEPNVGQSIMANWFGDYSGFYNWQNQRMTNFVDAISRIEDAMHQENYNSEQAQLQRRKAAGLNDDLSGGSSIAQGDAGNVDQTEMANAPINDGQSFLPNIASAVTSVFSLTLQFMQGIKGFQLQNAELANKELGIFKDATNEALNYMVGQMPEELFGMTFFNPDGEFKDKDADRFFSAAAQAYEQFKYTGIYKSLPSHARKYLRSSFNAAYNRTGGIEGRALYEELTNRYLKSRQSNATIKADERFSSEFGEWVQNSMESVNAFWKSDLSKSLSGARSASAEADIKEYQSKKISSLDGLFDGIEKSIPQNKDWSPFAHMATQFVKMLTISKFFGM